MASGYENLTNNHLYHNRNNLAVFAKVMVLVVVVGSKHIRNLDGNDDNVGGGGDENFVLSTNHMIA